MHESRLVMDIILKNTRLFTAEPFSRWFYSILTLHILGGRATPARIKAFLQQSKDLEEVVGSYRTFLKVFEEISPAIRKEYGEYVLDSRIHDYISFYKSMLKELETLIDKALKAAENNPDEAITSFRRNLFELLKKSTDIANDLLTSIFNDLVKNPDYLVVRDLIVLLHMYITLIIGYADLVVVKLLEEYSKLKVLDRTLIERCDGLLTILSSRRR